jgi:hypothetical protein
MCSVTGGERGAVRLPVPGRRLWATVSECVEFMTVELARRITTELQSLIGLPLTEFRHITGMTVVGFGSLRTKRNFKGEEVSVRDFSLHLQCRWRLTDAERIVFGVDDMFRPADPNVPYDEFDHDEGRSQLDLRWDEWMAVEQGKRHVTSCAGDPFGGFLIELEGGFSLESFPCDSWRGEYSEQWRLLGPQRHFVVNGRGVLE